MDTRACVLKRGSRKRARSAYPNSRLRDERIGYDVFVFTCTQQVHLHFTSPRRKPSESAWWHTLGIESIASMSLNYTHLLIARPPFYRPTAKAVAEFVREMTCGGHVGATHRIWLSRVIKRPRRLRAVHNVCTGETVEILCPSRRCEPPTELADVERISAEVTNQAEYDIVISSDDRPIAPPLTVGYVENGIWNPMVEAYHLEVRCRVRAHAVQLSRLDSEDDVTRPADLANVRSLFDEDCSDDARDGLFVHPELGVLAIPYAGCAMFWIEFNYAKFSFPKATGHGVNIPTNTVVSLAQETFGTGFVQACNWG
jgi:hypothetical protein